MGWEFPLGIFRCFSHFFNGIFCWEGPLVSSRSWGREFPAALWVFSGEFLVFLRMEKENGKEKKGGEKRREKMAGKEKAGK